MPMPGKRFTRGEARAALLEAGLQIMAERGPSPGLDRVSFAEAIEASGVPRPSAYRAFVDPDSEPQEHFRDQLAVEVIDKCAFRILEPTALAVQPLLEAAAKDDATSDDLDWLLRETIRVGIKTYQDHVANDPLFVTFISLLAARHRDPYLSQVLHQAEVEAQKQYIAFYRDLLEAFGLRLRATWTWEALATTLTAIQTGDHLISGIAIQAPPLDRPTGRNGETVPWALYACMVEAMFVAATEPDPRMVVSAQPHRWVLTD